jgi:hypothetical protein
MNNYESKYWLFTWETNVLQKKLPDLQKLKRHLNIVCDNSTFQLERGKISGKEHIQGGLHLYGPRKSKKQLLEAFQTIFGNVSGLTLQIAHDKEAIMKYSAKDDTRISETIYCGRKEKFDESVSSTTLRPWQQAMYKELLRLQKDDKAKGRKVIWLEDSVGNTGKSFFVKWLRVGQKKLTARKMPVNTVDRLISAVAKNKNVDLFMFDFTRVKPETQSYADVFCAIEDIKNGYVVDVMYGNYVEEVFNPPLVLIVTNEKIYDFVKYLSVDRWARYVLNSEGDLEIWPVALQPGISQMEIVKLGKEEK